MADLGLNIVISASAGNAITVMGAALESVRSLGDGVNTLKTRVSDMSTVFAESNDSLFSAVERVEEFSEKIRGIDSGAGLAEFEASLENIKKLNDLKLGFDKVRAEVPLVMKEVSNLWNVIKTPQKPKGKKLSATDSSPSSAKRVGGVVGGDQKQNNLSQSGSGMLSAAATVSPSSGSKRVGGVIGGDQKQDNISESGSGMLSVAAAGLKTVVKLAAPEVTELGDAVAHVGANTASNALSVTRILVKNNDVLKSTTNLTSAEMAGLSGAFDSVAPDAESAASAQRDFISVLSSGESATEAQKTAMSKLGFSSTELAERMQTDTKGAVTDVLSALNGFSEGDRQDVISSMFKSESSETISGLASDLTGYNNTMELVADKANYAGAMQSEYDRIITASSEKIQQMGSTLRETRETLSSVSSGISDFKAGLQRTKELLTVNNLKLGMMKIKTMEVGAAGRVISIITKGWAVAQMLLNAAMIANPIGLVVVGVGALIAGIVLLYKKSETFRSILKAVFLPWVTTFKSIWNFVKKIGGVLGKVGKFFGFGGKSEVKAETTDKKVVQNISEDKKSVRTVAKNLPSAGGQKSITLNYSPTINAQNSDPEAIKNILDDDKTSLMSQLNDAMAGERRLAYE